MSDPEDFGEDEIEPDPFEDAAMNCHLFRGDDGYLYCGAVGSEGCDQCPFYEEIGKRWKRRSA